MWDRSLRADCPPVEHLGVFAVPEQHALPEVRVREDEVCQLADAVAGLPGGMEVKERLLLGKVLAKITFAAFFAGVGSQFADGEGLLPCFAGAVHLVPGGARVECGLTALTCILS